MRITLLKYLWENAICQVSFDSWKNRRIRLKNYFGNYGHPIIAWFTSSKALLCITVIYNSTYIKEFLKYLEMWYEF